MAAYVVLATADDGTYSITGTATGHPFRSERAAERAGEALAESVADWQVMQIEASS